jgi:hypothetical protein
VYRQTDRQKNTQKYSRQIGKYSADKYTVEKKIDRWTERFTHINRQTVMQASWN